MPQFEDLISRNAAITALEEMCEHICDKNNRSFMCVSCPVGSALNVLENIPSGQLEPASEPGATPGSC